MKKFFFSYMLCSFALLWSTGIFAICPLCTIAVGAGIGLAQWLGIDDTITGLWIGGLIVSLIGWTINWLNKKNIRFFGRKILIVVGYYVLVVGPLYWKGLVGHALNKLWGIDKLILGIIVGGVIFIFSVILYAYMKKHNQDRAYFPLQKVVMPVVFLTIASFVFYCLTK